MKIIPRAEWGARVTSPLLAQDLRKIDAIALHHMAHPTADIKEVEHWHIDTQGWRALGYNYWIGFDGAIYEGRGLNMGAGVENQNDHILSIGFQGDFHSHFVKMSDAQFNSGVYMIKKLLGDVPTIKKVDEHGAYMPTACAGQYFPLEEMKTLKERGTTMDYADIVKKSGTSAWAEASMIKACKKGIIVGDENGNITPQEPVTKEQLVVIFDRLGLLG